MPHRNLLVAILLLCAASVQTAERKVLILGIDGLRPDCLEPAGPLPALSALKAQAAWTDKGQTITNSVSGPAWTTILCGVGQERHRLHGNSFTADKLASFPSLFHRLREAKPTLTTAAISSWAQQTEVILKGGAQVSSTFTDYDNESVTAAAEALFARKEVADLIFVGFDEPDHAGHKSAFSPTEKHYLEMIRTIDGMIGRVMAAQKKRLKARAQEDWLVIVISDHGGKGNKHGGDSPEELTIPFWVCGSAKAVERGEIKEAVATVDMAPTIATFLGIRIDPAWGWEGRPRGLKGLR